MGTLIRLDDPSVWPVLPILLQDRTMKRNIIWATGSYDTLGEYYRDREQITAIALQRMGKDSIQPRIMKGQEEQQQRTRKHGEVQTPAWLCCRMNEYLDAAWFERENVFNVQDRQTWVPVEGKIVFPKHKHNSWRQYVDSRRLEITCGEAPFISSRYDAATGESIPIERRIGLLDRKLRIVSENTDNEVEWLKWAIRAVQSVYGYEYQGDNLLIARINVLMTFVEYLQAIWHRGPTEKELTTVANVISWNFWQMDGLTGTVPKGRLQAPEQEATAIQSCVKRPNSFALREVDDALLYVLDGSVWMAQGMNADAARRIAVCGELSGQGLMLDDATYAVLHGNSVQVFDLTTPPGEMDELVVDGDGWNYYANQTFIAEHPDIAIVSDPGKNAEDNERYSDRMLSGKAAGDVVALEQDGFERVRDAGLIAPLTDPELRAEWEKLPEGLQAFLSVNGQPAAIPLGVCAYPDVAFLTENWDDIRGSFEDAPDTWPEYIRWLGEYSHSETAGDYVIEFDALDGSSQNVAEAFEAYTLLSMADAYARCWKALGETVDFSKPEFTACLEALEGVDWNALRYHGGDTVTDGKDRRAMLFYSDYEPHEDAMVTRCTLRIRPDAPMLSRASGTFVFVPAASTSRATAQEYLKTLARVNHTAYDGSPEAVYFDFATDPEDFASAWGGAYMADATRHYREQVGDFSFCVNLTPESVVAIQEATNRYVVGQISQEEWLECLREAY